MHPSEKRDSSRQNYVLLPTLLIICAYARSRRQREMNIEGSKWFAEQVRPREGDAFQGDGVTSVRSPINETSARATENSRRNVSTSFRYHNISIRELHVPSLCQSRHADGPERPAMFQR